MDKFYYEYKDDGDVKYCYPGTSILINKFDIRDGQQLSTVEREISIVKAAVLSNRITGNFDLKHLKSIHRFMFEDIYSWAGQIRRVDIAKGNIFCLVQFIETQFAELYAKLKEDNFLKGESDIEYVSKKISFYLSEINVIHPFREGNGRVQRVYCQQLCMNTGHFYLDFSMAGENEMLEASVDAFIRKYEKMDSLIRKCIKEELAYTSSP
ncbi:MAG: Fic family protein [Clostridiales bacterium]|nr:Fic family protein [Clostridiales bacterium]